MEIPAGLTESAFFKLLGCRLHSLETGVAQVALALEPELRNRGGKLHGGALFSLLVKAVGAGTGQPHGNVHQAEQGPAVQFAAAIAQFWRCLLYTSPSPRDGLLSRMPSSA